MPVIYEVQNVNSAFGRGSDIPWPDGERFRDYYRAAARERKLANSHVLQGGTAWNGHTRLILAEDSDPSLGYPRCAHCGNRIKGEPMQWRPGEEEPLGEYEVCDDCLRGW